MPYSRASVGLLLAALRHSQVIEAEVSGNMRLIVPRIQRSRLGDVRPFGEAVTPPFVVFRDRMELRQVEAINVARTAAESAASSQPALAPVDPVAA